MKPTLSFAILFTICLALGCGVNAAEPEQKKKDAEAKEVKIIAGVPLNTKIGLTADNRLVAVRELKLPGDNDKAQQIVIRSEKELEKATGIKDVADVAKMFKTASVDFKKEMLILVTGDKTTIWAEDLTLAITKVEQSNDGKILTAHTLRVDHHLFSVGGPAVVPTPRTFCPGFLVLVEKKAGELRVVEKRESKSTKVGTVGAP